MTPNEKKILDLGNEVVRLRNVLANSRGTLDIFQFMSDLLEVVNLIRVLSYSKTPEYIQHHCCNRGDFTCHFLGKKLTLTYQKPGTDSEHTLVKICPFCGFNPEKEFWCF